MRTQSTQWDVIAESRPGDIRRMEEIKKDVVQSYASCIQKPSSSGVPIHQVSVLDDYGQEIDDLLEERVQEVQVNAVRTRRRPDNCGRAKETFRQRAAAERKIARLKTKRPSVYVPQESTQLIEGMDVDEITRPGFRLTEKLLKTLFRTNH
jgi:hypothetical protein